MRVVEQSANRLVLQDRPVENVIFVGGFLAVSLAILVFGLSIGEPFTWAIGGGFALLLAALLYWQIEWLDVAFDRSDDSLTLIRRTLSGTRQERYPLHAIQDVITERRRDPESGEAYRVRLRIEGETSTIPLTSYLASGQGSAETAETITQWLEDPGAD